MKFKGLAAVLIGSVLTLRLQAETVRSLSLEECTRIALEHNLDIQINRLDPQLKTFALAGSYANYDPTLSFGARHDYNLTQGGLDSNNLPYPGSENDANNVSGGLDGLLPWGLSYGLGVNLSDRWGNYLPFDANGNPLPGVPFETTSGNAGIFTMRQPLLKNFWIDNTRLQIFLNKKNLNISELGLRSRVINTVTEVEAAYYNLIYAEDNVKVQAKALELAERLVAENKRRVEVGALAPLDEKQAESQAAANRADLLDARANRDTAERVLKNLLSDNYSEWMDVRVEPSEKLLAVPQSLNLQESWRKGMAERPDLLQARISVEQQTKIVSYSKNQLYPQLDLLGSYGYTGSGVEFSGALNQIGNLNNPYYSYGVAVTVPLARTGARNSFKSAKVTKEQLQLQLKQLEQNALILIENSMANARSSLNGLTPRGRRPFMPMMLSRRNRPNWRRARVQLCGAATPEQPHCSPARPRSGAFRLQHRPGASGAKQRQVLWSAATST